MDGEQSLYWRVAAALDDMPWAILPEKLATIRAVLAERQAGHRLSAAEIAQRVGGARPSPPSVSRTGAIAVIPVFGVIAQRMPLLVESSGGTSTERVAADLKAALADPSITSIVLNVDSPGGAVPGVPELASLIYRARNDKPVVAIANALAASAAYWIASAASEVVVTPSGEVGGIGILAAHEDRSAMYQRLGVRTTLVAAGKYKTEGSPFAPLNQEAQAYLQTRIDALYGMFVHDVARGRTVAPDAVRKGFGQGRTVPAKQALRLGMVDRVATLDQTLARLSRGAAVGQRTTGALSGGELDYRRRRLAFVGLGH